MWGRNISANLSAVKSTIKKECDTSFINLDFVIIICVTLFKYCNFNIDKLTN